MADLLSAQKAYQRLEAFEQFTLKYSYGMAEKAVAEEEYRIRHAFRISDIGIDDELDMRIKKAAMKLNRESAEKLLNSPLEIHFDAESVRNQLVTGGVVIDRNVEKQLQEASARAVQNLQDYVRKKKKELAERDARRRLRKVPYRLMRRQI